jgi:hypothetical protein
MARFTGTRTPPTTAAPFDSGSLQADLADRIVGLVFSDTAGTLFLDQSVTGQPSQWDYVQQTAVTGGTGVGFSFELLAPFYRIRYVPTANPTVFRLGSRPTSAGPR